MIHNSAAAGLETDYVPNEEHIEIRLEHRIHYIASIACLYVTIVYFVLHFGYVLLL